MPYSDPDKRKQVKRDSARRCRVGTESFGSTVTLPEGTRLETAQGWLDVLNAVTRQVLAEECETLAKARTIASLTSIGLRIVEMVNIDERVTKLESLFERRENGETEYPSTITNP